MFAQVSVWMLVHVQFHSNSRLRLHEGHAGGLIVVGVDGRHHLAADRVEDGQGGEGPRDLPILRHAPQLLAGLLDGAVVNQLDAGERRRQHAWACVIMLMASSRVQCFTYCNTFRVLEYAIMHNRNITSTRTYHCDLVWLMVRDMLSEMFLSNLSPLQHE